jgi:hypothetical protein
MHGNLSNADGTDFHGPSYLLQAFAGYLRHGYGASLPGCGKNYFVIPSEARNLSFFSRAEAKERFLASLGMTKSCDTFFGTS